MADRETEKLISAETAEALIAAHDGDVALYCLYLARHPGADDAAAAAVLCRTRGEIAAAREKLGLILGGDKGETAAAPPLEEATQYPSDEIVRVCRKPEFEDVQKELTRILGETPSRAYLNALVDMYERLGMPPEVIMLLLNHCADETRRRWGSGRRPSAKMISEEAYYWARCEILTLEAAEEHMAALARRREDKTRILELLGIRGREPSKSESTYMEAWREMGFPDETIALAYDRTLTNTGSLKWAYLNGILKKWHAAGLHGPEEVERAEGRRRAAASPAERGHGDPVDGDELAAFMGEKA